MDDRVLRVARTVADSAASRVLPLECRDVTVRRNGRALLDGIDARFDGTHVSVVMGANGAGKSLLLRVLANIIPPDRGTVRWGQGPPERGRAPAIGFVFQKPVMLRRSVLSNVTYALAAVGIDRRTRTERAQQMLSLASLEHLARAPARVLSGGEQQRLALARALATRPQVLLLDEPTSSLDPAATLAIEQLLQAARERGTKLIFVTHEVRQAKRLADEIMFLHLGQIAELTPAQRFFDSPASEPGRAFLEGRLVA